jgi:uncharacterized protein YqhQ
MLKNLLLALAKQYTSIGGQAVIEGVMMRSPHTFVIAVREADGSIRLRKDQWFGFVKRFPLLKKPFIRGVVVLIESMANGIVALNYSANLMMKEEMKKEALQKGKTEAEFLADQKNSEKVNLTTFITMIFSFLFGIGLFVFIPHWLTIWMGHDNVQSFSFHFIDGLVKAFIFVGYILAIGLLPDIKRIFQYHGAEHKSIATFEAELPLTVENARKFSTLHPRCGTTFIFFLIFISILFFSAIFTVLTVGNGLPFILKHIVVILFKILFMFPVAGISYEILKWSGAHSNSPFARIVGYPGMMLQKITTREPDDAQLEVALASIKAALTLEEKFNLKDADQKIVNLEEINIAGLSDLETTNVKLKDFLE